MRISLTIVLLAVAACSTAPLISGGDLAGADLTATPAVDLTAGGADSPGWTPDFLGPPQNDQAVGNPVQCGQNTCQWPTNTCCSSDHGFSGTCVTSPSQCPSGIAYQCDSSID